MDTSIRSARESVSQSKFRSNRQPAQAFEPDSAFCSASPNEPPNAPRNEHPNERANGRPRGSSLLSGFRGWNGCAGGRADGPRNGLDATLPGSVGRATGMSRDVAGQLSGGFRVRERRGNQGRRPVGVIPGTAWGPPTPWTPPPFSVSRRGLRRRNRGEV
jgi:hypothetical protein